VALACSDVPDPRAPGAHVVAERGAHEALTRREVVGQGAERHPRAGGDRAMRDRVRTAAADQVDGSVEDGVAPTVDPGLSSSVAACDVSVHLYGCIGHPYGFLSRTPSDMRSARE